MIQTWKLKSLDETHQQQLFNPETARPLAQQACNSCRIKKLRCSGQKSGCSRCLTLAQECIYAEPGTRGRGRKRKPEDNNIPKSTENERKDRPCTPENLLSPERASSFKADVLQSGVRSEHPNSDLLGPFTHSRTDSMVSGNSAMDMIAHETRDMDSVTTRIPSPTTPRDVPGRSMPWQDISYESNTFQFKDMSELDMLDEGGTNLFLSSTMTMNDLFVPSYSDLLLPDTPGSISAVLNYPSMNSHKVSMTDVAGLSKDIICVDRNQRAACQCLQRVVLLLEEVDCLDEEGAAQEPGAWLSRLKEALRCGRALLSCSSCQTKPENISILGLLTDRLTTMCEMLVRKYLEIAKLNGPCDALVNAASTPWLISLGEFEIDRASEWAVLVRAVLIMQLKSLDSLIDRLKVVVDPAGMRKKMDAMQRRTHGLLDMVTQAAA